MSPLVIVFYSILKFLTVKKRKKKRRRKLRERKVRTRNLVNKEKWISQSQALLAKIRKGTPY